MRRTFAILGSAIFFLLAPCVVAGLIPWWISGWRFAALPPAWMPLRIFGALLIALGAAVLVDAFARFALQGLGTPAPVFPTKHLVVSGWYRYVRNPIYVAVVAVILGQGLLLWNFGLIAYGAAIWLAFHVFVLLYEEPVLRSTFAVEYEEFCRRVPRWIPRRTAWRAH